jgi:hypothetical protein
LLYLFFRSVKQIDQSYKKKEEEIKSS